MKGNEVLEIDESEDAPAIHCRVGYPLRVSRYVADHNDINYIIGANGKPQLLIRGKNA